MAAYAFSVIKELTPEGKVKLYQPGDRIDDLGKERVAHLLNIGAAANYDRTKSTGEQVQDVLQESESLKRESAALKSKVSELEAKLAEATKSQTKAQSSATAHK